MKVIAYLHTHWDREWYKEFEVFRLRLLEVFDNVLDMLVNNEIPSFYFDGQTAALQDYLEIRPEKTDVVKDLIKMKKLFIGPFYTLVDEYLTDEFCFRKNLELGLEYSKSMGCEDFIGYFADTFGHTQAVPLILKEFGIDKAMVWRGVPTYLPSEFIFNGVNTVNMIRGYFNNIFSENIPIEIKAQFLQGHLDKIASKSKNILLMPIGADHLGVPRDIKSQINKVNKLLKGYEIELSNPFEYFKLVKDNFIYEHNDELRDNSQTFILQGCYSARADIKKYSAKASRLLNRANKLSIQYKKDYKNIINYAYKLMLQNLAHDSICGCSRDEVHSENIMRYKKVIQIAKTIIKEISYKFDENEISDKDFKGILYFNSFDKNLKDKDIQFIEKQPNCVKEDIWYDTQNIPITEDFKVFNTFAKAYNLPENSDLKVSDNFIENTKIKLEIKNNKIVVTDKVSKKTYDNFFEIVDYKDLGDTYNSAPDVNDRGTVANIVSSKLLRNGSLISALDIKFKLKNENFKMTVCLNKSSHLLNFKTEWVNKHKDHLLQVRFNLKEPVKTTFAQSMGYLFEREFNPDYDIRKNLPKTRGLEAKTNTAPFQKYLWSQGVEFITDGIFEYEVFKKSLSLTILRSTGIISNPKNPARTTPAGPPILLKDAQLLGERSTEFSIGFGDKSNREKSLNEALPDAVILHQAI